RSATFRTRLSADLAEIPNSAAMPSMLDPGCTSSSARHSRSGISPTGSSGIAFLLTLLAYCPTTPSGSYGRWRLARCQTAPVPSITGQVEVNLTVRDPARSATWYSQLLGLQQLYDYTAADGS